jgi:hypothetical protein
MGQGNGPSGFSTCSAFFDFLLRQPSPIATVLKLLAKTPLPTALQNVGKEFLHFCFFSFQLFCGSFLL